MPLTVRQKANIRAAAAKYKSDQAKRKGVADEEWQRRSVGGNTRLDAQKSAPVQPVAPKPVAPNAPTPAPSLTLPARPSILPQSVVNAFKPITIQQTTIQPVTGKAPPKVETKVVTPNGPPILEQASSWEEFEKSDTDYRASQRAATQQRIADTGRIDVGPDVRAAFNPDKRRELPIKPARRPMSEDLIGLPTEEALARFAQGEAAYPMSERTRQAMAGSEGKGFWGSILDVISNPLASAEVGYRSLEAAGPTSTILSLLPNPLTRAAGAFTGSIQQERLSTLMELMQQRYPSIDLTSRESLEEAIASDPEFWQTAMKQANTAGTIKSLGEALSGAIAGPASGVVNKNPLAKRLVNAVVERFIDMGFAGGGEYLGEAGKEIAGGKSIPEALAITNKNLSNVAWEAGSEFVAGAPQLGGALMERRPGPTQAPVAPPPREPIAAIEQAPLPRPVERVQAPPPRETPVRGIAPPEAVTGRVEAPVLMNPPRVRAEVVAPARPAGPAPVAKSATPAPGEVKAWEMNRDELAAAYDEARAYEDNADVQALGEKGAQEWRRLQRQLNSTDSTVTGKAQGRISEIEATLTPDQERLLYGIGETRPSAESLKDALDAVEYIETADSSAELSRRVGRALTQLGGKTDVSQMDSGQQRAYTQLAAAARVAQERGYDADKVIEDAFNSAGKEIGDPQDIELMLGDLWKARTPAKPAKPAAGEVKIAKEPWEMNRDEWAQKAFVDPVSREEFFSKPQSNRIERWLQEDPNVNGWTSDYAKHLVDSIKYNHQVAVEQALKDGKPVPASVLADYPDLAPAKSAGKGKGGEVAVVRPKGWEAQNEVPATWTRKGHVYRGLTAAEYDATIGAGKGVQSRRDYSLAGEGTSFSDKADDAEAYVNFGRDDPRKTGKPNYLIEVSISDDLVKDTDGYYKAQKEIAPDRVTRVIRMSAVNGEIVAEDVAQVKPKVKPSPAPVAPAKSAEATGEKVTARKVGETKPRTFMVNGKSATLTNAKDILQFDEIEADYQRGVRHAEQWKTDDPELYQKQMKAAGMRRSAERRKLTGELTGKERKAEAESEARLKIGDNVTVDGKPGVVANYTTTPGKSPTAVSRGKVRVQFKDSSTKVVDYSSVQKAAGINTLAPPKPRNIAKEAKKRVEATPAPEANTPFRPAVSDFGEKNTLVTKSEADAALERVLRKTGRLSANIDPTVIKDMAKVGAYYIEGGIRQFGDWAAKMRGHFGKDAEPYLRRIYTLSNGNLSKLRKFPQSVKDAPIAPAELTEKINENPPTYEPISNEATLQAAQARINADITGGFTTWRDIIAKQKMTAEDVAVGEDLIRRAINEGRIDEANLLTTELAEMLTQAGQTVQAASMIKRMTPEGMLVFAKRSLDRANALLPEKAKTANLSDVDAARIVNLMKRKAELAVEGDLDAFVRKYEELIQSKEFTPSQTRALRLILKRDVLNASDRDAALTAFRKRIDDVLTARVMQIIADAHPVTFGDRLRALQRISMLLNPKTVLSRNVLGNVLMNAVTNFSETLAIPIDVAVKVFTKKSTTTAPSLTTQGGAFAKGVRNVVDDIRLGVDTSPSRTQFELPQGRVFHSNFWNGLDQVVRRGLTFGDRPFYEAAYEEALRQYMRTNSLTEATVEAREYATRVAQIKTYVDTNTISEAFEGLRNTLNGDPTGRKGTKFGFGNIVLPFTKTPANILARALDFSVGGAVRTARAAGLKRGGGFDQRAFVKNLSQTLTGAGLIIAGYTLASMGMLRGAPEKKKRKEQFLRATGKSPYSYYVGGYSYTYDWAQPASFLIAMGANMHQTGVSKEDATTRVTEAIIAGGDTLFNMSVMQGLRGLVGYGSVVEGLMKTAMDTPLQAVPTVTGQTARAIDSTMRMTYSPSELDSVMRKMKARVPFLSRTLQPRINIRGEKALYAGGAFAQYLSPANIAKIEEGAVDKEILRLYAITGDSEVFPRAVQPRFSYEKKEYILTPEQYTKFQQLVGTTTYIGLARIFSESSYKLNDEQGRADMAQKVVRAAYNSAKAHILSEEYGITVGSSSGPPKAPKPPSPPKPPGRAY